MLGGLAAGMVLFRLLGKPPVQAMDMIFLEPLRSPAVADGQMGLLRSFDFDTVDSLAEAHARITAPILLVWGEDDDFFPVARARRMLEGIANGTMETIPRGKLFAHEDHPEAFARSARAFLLCCLAGSIRAPIVDPLSIRFVE